MPVPNLVAALLQIPNTQTISLWEVEGQIVMFAFEPDVQTNNIVIDIKKVFRLHYEKFWRRNMGHKIL